MTSRCPSARARCFPQGSSCVPSWTPGWSSSRLGPSPLMARAESPHGPACVPSWLGPSPLTAVSAFPPGSGRVPSRPCLRPLMARAESPDGLRPTLVTGRPGSVPSRFRPSPLTARARSPHGSVSRALPRSRTPSPGHRVQIAPVVMVKIPFVFLSTC